MIKIKLILLIISIGLLFSCSSNKSKNKNNDKQIVIVSILPLKTFVEEISGDDFEVHVLLPPGSSPADFTLIPSQLKSIASAKLWLRIGHIGFEYSWKEKIEQANQNMKVIDLSEGLNLITDENLPSGEINKTSGVNPHTWLSPALVKKMAVEIAKQLQILVPENTQKYQDNLKQFSEKIEKLDKQIKNDLAQYKGEPFIMFHPSLAYFAREYNLIQYSLEPGGKEPTPQRMAALVDFAKQEGIKVIYIQSDMDKEQARVFAEEIKGEVEQMWPLNPEWFDNLIEITNMLNKHFQ